MTSDPIFLPDEAATEAAGREFVARLSAGDVVFLHGELGAGKTTFVRGALAALGWKKDVRSPSFNILLRYDTTPPVIHADFYRIHGASAENTGLSDYWEGHIFLIEWAENAVLGLDESEVYHVALEFSGEGRVLRVTAPG